ncbi:RPM1-interacting protein 4-like [Selaginella moellendorffii]|uniref:RPM1-interacting protein 4-like n=1 Tax=Selaginella moellendorffii TaxID=88036 RepID=UPI000D1CC75E|nr:RPM1-interacting protein 4-like [Selaginella moellendorffii]|eukprot:XP_024521478.1 RPM1-interacting protein 4-like [Selaginella moellendorffii]
MKDELEESRSSSSGHGGSGSPNPARRSMESSNSAHGARSPLHPRAGAAGSGARKPPGEATPTRKSHSRFVDPPERVAAPLPKFGQWDVNNPSSADEFSAIFEDAVVEKRGDSRGGGIAYGYSDRDRSSSSFDRKKPKSITERLCCCFTPRIG